MSGPGPNTFTQRQPVGTQGSPEWQEYKRIFDTAMAARNSPKGYTPEEINDYITRQVGAGSPVLQDPKGPMVGLTRALMAQGQAGGEPLTGQEAASARLLSVGNAMGLGWPAKTWPDVTKDLVQRFQQQAPLDARVTRMIGGLPPFAIATASGNPWLAGAGAGAAGALQTAAEIPPGTPAGKAAKAIGESGLLNAALGGVGTAALHGIAGRFSPAAEQLEAYTKMAGGPDAVLDKAAQMEAATPGVKPMLMETSPRFSRLATRGIPSKSPEAQAQMVKDVQASIQEAENARATVGAKYQQLETPINDPKVNEVLQRPAVQSFLKELHDAGQLPEGPVSGRTLNDLRLLLQQRATALAKTIQKTPDPVLIGTRKQYSGAVSDLNDMLTQNVKGFADIQKEYGPYAQRVAERKALLTRMAGPLANEGIMSGRSTGMIPAPETSIKGQLQYHAGTLPWQRQLRAAVQLGRMLTKPAGEAVPEMENLWPWYTKPVVRGAVPAVGGALADSYITQGLLSPPEQPK